MKNFHAQDQDSKDSAAVFGLLAPVVLIVVGLIVLVIGLLT